MKKLELNHIFQFPLRDVVRGREARYENPQWWPEILEGRIESEEKKDGITHRRRKIVLENKLPTNKFLTEKHYVVTENCREDLDANLYELEAVLESHRNLIEFTEISKYKEFRDGNDIKTIRTVDLSVHLKVPVVGALMEAFIVREFAKLSNKDRDLINDFLSGRL